MKKPGGTIDLIGSGLLVAHDIASLVNEFAPDKKQRKINVAIRRLKHRWKNVEVEIYVDVNFSEYSEAERKQITAEIRDIVGRI